MKCHDCGGALRIGSSTFPGFDLLACERCGRPIKLIVLGKGKPKATKAFNKAQTNRAMRAARRMKIRREDAADRSTD